MKKVIFNLCLSGLFFLTLAVNASAQSEIIPADDRTALTTACEICTLKSNNQIKTDEQKRILAKLENSRVRWCPRSCELLEKVNRGERINSKEAAFISKIKSALNSENSNTRSTTN